MTTIADPTPLSDTRPLLRGYLHAGAAVAAAVGGSYLVAQSGDDRPRQLSLVVYGAALTLLFAFSAAYHVRTWTPARRVILRRIDHANIFILIAATYTPLAFNLLSGWWRVGVLGATWGVALVGVGIAVTGNRLGRWARTGLYVGLGWVALPSVGQMAAVLPWTGIGLIITGGALYSVGAVLYAGRRPDPWPRVFGYHEVFHVLTVAAAAVFYVVILVFVLPAPRL